MKHISVCWYDGAKVIVKEWIFILINLTPISAPLYELQNTTSFPTHTQLYVPFCNELMDAACTKVSTMDVKKKYVMQLVLIHFSIYH